MDTIFQVLQEATGRLEPITETPRLDAEILLSHALGCTRAQLLARLRDPAPHLPAFETLLARRLNHEPIAYILGTWEFFSLEFTCRAPILVPRPETEHLVEAALAHLKRGGGDTPHVLDLCTGSGCVAVAISVNAPGARIRATDLNPSALLLAGENAARHGTAITFHGGDLFEALPQDDVGAFDVIVSNPPYVEEDAWKTLPLVIQKHEDPAALLAGAAGLDVIQRIIAEAGSRLRPGGLLALEIGESQFEAVDALMAQHGFECIPPFHDLSGHPRIARGCTSSHPR